MSIPQKRHISILHLIYTIEMHLICREKKYFWCPVTSQFEGGLIEIYFLLFSEINNFGQKTLGNSILYQFLLNIKYSDVD